MKKTIKFIFLTLLVWIVLSAFSIVSAATATIKPNKTSVTVGDSATVTVTVNAAAWNLKVSGSASDTIVGYNAEAENQTITKTYKIDTSKAGTYKVTLSGDVTDEAKDNADTIDTSTTITVNAKVVEDKKEETDKNETNKDTATDKNAQNVDKKEEVTKPKEKSNNAYLSTLGVRIKNDLAKELGVKVDEYDFTGFSKTKTSYNVTIPKNVDYLNVVYGKANSNATVKVTGNSGFEVGSNNKISIKVTAEDGKTTKTYTIKVTKLAEEEEKPGNLIEDTEELYLTSLNIKGIELLPEFTKDIYSYTATLDDPNVNEVEVTAQANNKNAKIDISGNTNLVEGENTINILLTLEDTTVQTVYQINLEKEVLVDTETSSTNSKSSTENIIGMFKGYIGIAVCVLLFMIIAVIVLIILLRRENKKTREEEYEDEEIESKTQEYNVYKNDENEFTNNSIEKDNFIESLYKQRNGEFDEEELTESEIETLEEINKQTEEIFREKVKGQSVEYTSDDIYDENPLKVRRRRRGKGKHSL